jgi:hypothetical protein
MRMKICEQGQQILFDKILTSLIEFSCESIRTWSLIMFHLEYCMTYFILTERFY